MRRITIVLAAAAFLTLVGCSTGSPPTTPTPAPGSEAVRSSSAPSPASSDPTPSAAGSACPSGTYVLTGFSGTGLSTTRISATGDDVTIAFTSGRYRLEGTGKPYQMKGENPGETAQLAIDGFVEGSYTGDGAQLTAEPGQGDGTFTLTAEGKSRSGDIETLGRTIAPHGSAATACDGDAATVTMETIELTLRRS